MNAGDTPTSHQQDYVSYFSIIKNYENPNPKFWVGLNKSVG